MVKLSDEERRALALRLKEELIPQNPAEDTVAVA